MLVNQVLPNKTFGDQLKVIKLVMHGLNVSDFAFGCKQQEGFIDKSCPLHCYLGDKQTEQNRKSTKCTWGRVADPFCPAFLFQNKQNAYL